MSIFFLQVREFLVLHRMVGRTWRKVLTPGYFEPCSFPSCSIVWFSLLFTKAYFLPVLDAKLFQLNKLKESHRNIFLATYISLFACLHSVISNQHLRIGGGKEKCKPNNQKNSGETALGILLLINFYHNR